MSTIVRGTAVIALLPLFACAEAQHSRSQLETANDSFAKSIRWSDLRGLGQQIIPERQAEFSRLSSANEESLKVTDYETLDVQLGTDTAVVHSKVSWYREPSVTTRTDSMSVLWEAKGTAWWIVAIVGGPLPLPPVAPAHPK